jgi:hypothetical protein
MDYHLDWIYASLYLTARADDDAIHVNTSRKQISATQEDVDLLVAFEVGGVFHLIMLEAKGATGWTNRQLAQKASRLRAIFGDSGTSWQSAVPHFVIASPVESSRLLSADWPGWMTDKGRPVWLPMQMPSLAHHPLRRAWASIGQRDLLDGGQTRGRFETWTLIARAT